MKAKPTTKAKPAGLEGRCFLSFNAENKIVTQGVIVTHLPSDILLIRFFDWFIGAPNDLALVRLSDWVRHVDNHRGERVMLFNDDAHLREWCDLHPQRD